MTDKAGRAVGPPREFGNMPEEPAQKTARRSPIKTGSNESITAVARRTPMLTDEEAIAFLDRAGAKKPWARPEACHQLAVAVHVARVQLIWGMQEPHTKDQFQRAQAAIDELRRVLPTLISWLSMEAAPDENEHSHRDAMDKERIRLENLRCALFDVLPKTGRRKAMGHDWHEHGVSFWLIYRHIVGKASASRNGPAVRFVAAILKHVGYGLVQLSAIETTLSRWLAAGGNDRIRLLDDLRS